MKWPEKSLDEVGYVGRGKSKHRPRDAAHLYGGQYPFIQTGDVKHSHLYITNFSQTYSEAGLAQSKLWKAGTLCITIAANIADTAILGIDACFPDSIIGFVPDPNKADARFIKYLFDALLKQRFKQFAQGAAQDNLSQSKLLSLKFPVPDDIAIQHKIADILSKYDDLIENNRRRIELLEESARLLYREWFVDLRFPSHEHTPIIDGIPEGWELVTLEKVLTITQGFSFKSQDFVEQETKNIVVTMGNFKENGGLKFNGKVKYLEENNYKEKYALKPHDLLIVMSDVTREGRIIGNVGLVPDDNNIYILNQRVAKLDLSNHLKLFFYMYFNSSKFKNHCLSRANSVTVLNLKNEHIYKHHVLLPSRLILSLFTDNIESIIKKIDVLTKYNIHLNTARDILIPRLMNGEIAV